MGRTVWVALIVSASVVALAQTASAPQAAKSDQEHRDWIAAALRSMQTIRSGNTRSELLVLFTTEGGLSTPTQRTYVYRGCPYIKVDVKFAVSNREEELPTDKIVEISRPYLAWSVAD